MDDEFPDIKTGNGIGRDLAATTNDRLKKTVLELRSLKDVIARLEKTIVGLDEKNGKLQTKLFWLTIVAVPPERSGGGLVPFKIVSRKV